MDPKAFFSIQIFFYPKTFFGQKYIFDPKIFSTKQFFFNLKFFSHNSSNLNKFWLSLAQLSPRLFYSLNMFSALLTVINFWCLQNSCSIACQWITEIMNPSWAYGAHHPCYITSCLLNHTCWTITQHFSIAIFWIAVDWSKSMALFWPAARNYHQGVIVKPVRWTAIGETCVLPFFLYGKDFYLLWTKIYAVKVFTWW